MRADFIWFSSDTPFGQVLKTMAKENVSSAPVFDGQKFMGILSSRAMVEYFSRKEFSLLWKKDKPSPLERMNGTTAKDFTKMPGIILGPDQELSGIISQLAKIDSCVPVVDGKRLVGLVRRRDLVTFFLKEVAKGAHKEETAKKAKSMLPSVFHPKATGGTDGVVDTSIDSLLELVKHERQISVKKAAESLGMPLKSVEGLANTLYKHHLIDMQYSFTGGAILRLVDHDKK